MVKIMQFWTSKQDRVLILAPGRRRGLDLDYSRIVQVGGRRTAGCQRRQRQVGKIRE